MEPTHIEVEGANAHNLRNVSIKIPRNRLTVVTGVSGSGKSSLVFDTIYAEGQRRYVESLSSYAKQVIGQMEKPDVLSVEGLSPAISIDQKTVSKNPRSNVGTITEITDYLRLLFATAGKPEEGAAAPEKLAPKMFSPNTPFGACTACSGIGSKMDIDPKLLVDRSKSIAGGAVLPWSDSPGHMAMLRGLADAAGIEWDKPLLEQDPRFSSYIVDGYSQQRIEYRYKSHHDFRAFEGVLKDLRDTYGKTSSKGLLENIEKFMVPMRCPACGGARLKQESLAVKIRGRHIADLTAMPVSSLLTLFQTIDWTETERLITSQLVGEIKGRLQALLDVGLDYLTLDRSADTLSGGEAQRVRLATQIGTRLCGVLYVMDEPSIGLHQRDNDKLIHTLKRLRDIGNTVLVVEHDEETMRAADWLIDMGPGAGKHGGRVLAEGTPEQVERHAASLTGAYLSGRKTIPVPASRRRTDGGKALVIRGAGEHNLKGIDVRIPLGVFVCVTGVSGSGKSTLINHILHKRLAYELHRAKTFPGKHDGIEGIGHLKKVIEIDQSPLGRTPTSTLATYTGMFDIIRELIASTSDAAERNYTKARFSFNVAGKESGRCEMCKGDGIVKIEMHFLPDVHIPCEQCRGRRYKEETLQVRYKGKNIADLLEMSVEEAFHFFDDHPTLKRILNTLMEVGLDYVTLGQPASELSGGEAQRIKLATELSRPTAGKTIYILDEPTTGLHAADIHKLLQFLHRLVDHGDTVLVVEHNLDVIKTADHVIDMGPEGGAAGGMVVAEGTPEEVAAHPDSITGRYLRAVLEHAQRQDK